MSWDAHILAGGRARRLDGRDKSALVVGDRRILDWQLAALRGHAARIVIVGGPQRGGEDGVEVIPDRLPGIGALGGLYTALVSATAERTLVLACDMPFVTGAFLEYLARCSVGYDAAAPRDRRGLHPLCAVYARAAAPLIRRSIDEGVRKVREAIEPLRIRVIEGAALEPFDPAGRLLENVNTPDDYARACRG
jgi:molybdopterin-guanine dinucleotide biosynthesis protein A